MNNGTPLLAYHAYPNSDLSLIAADLGHRSVSDESYPTPLLPLHARIEKKHKRRYKERRSAFVFAGTQRGLVALVA